MFGLQTLESCVACGQRLLHRSQLPLIGGKLVLEIFEALPLPPLTLADELAGVASGEGARLADDARVKRHHLALALCVAIVVRNLLGSLEVLDNHRVAGDVPHGLLDALVVLDDVEGKLGLGNHAQPLIGRLCPDRVEGQERHGRQLVVAEVLDAPAHRLLLVHHDGVHVALHHHRHGQLVLVLLHLAKVQHAPLHALERLREVGQALLELRLALVRLLVRPSIPNLAEEVILALLEGALERRVLAQLLVNVGHLARKLVLLCRQFLHLLCLLVLERTRVSHLGGRYTLLVRHAAQLLLLLVEVTLLLVVLPLVLVHRSTCLVRLCLGLLLENVVLLDLLLPELDVLALLHLRLLLVKHRLDVIILLLVLISRVLGLLELLLRRLKVLGEALQLRLARLELRVEGKHLLLLNLFDRLLKLVHLLVHRRPLLLLLRLDLGLLLHRLVHRLDVLLLLHEDPRVFVQQVGLCLERVLNMKHLKQFACGANVGLLLLKILVRRGLLDLLLDLLLLVVDQQRPLEDSDSGI
mmetsp:Transcript_19641/g.49222  ORF Transcript_19641/g.49222 Transcript_19641/m.49222 type:complete len:526 (+) Transcript_19641:1704-3281(+)